MEDTTDLSTLTASPELLAGGGPVPMMALDAVSVPTAVRVEANPFNPAQASTGDLNTDYAQSTAWRRFKQKLGAAQTAVVSPFQQLGIKAAKSVGVPEGTSTFYGGTVLPILIVGAVVALVVYLVRNRTRTVKA